MPRHASRRRRAAHRGATDESLTTYLNEISAYAMLTRAEEARLAQRAHEGDSDAVNQLVCANLRFVVSIAKKYQNRGVSLSDLIAEGNVGLLRAAERFDATRGVKFITYAVWWIRQTLLQTLADNGHAVRLPIGQAGALNRIGREANALAQELGRDPTQRELALELEVPEEAIAAALPIARGYVSLDAPIPGADDGNLLDLLADDDHSPDLQVAQEGMAECLHDSMSVLRGREAEVLSSYFGLDGRDPETLEEIGSRFGITRERVRQIKDKGLARLRKSKMSRTLAAYR